MPEQYVNTNNKHKMDLVQDLADEHGVNGNQIVLAWMRQSSRSIIPVFGCSTRDQLAENLGSLEVTLSADEFARLERVETLGDINR